MMKICGFMLFMLLVLAVVMAAENKSPAGIGSIDGECNDIECNNECQASGKYGSCVQVGSERICQCDYHLAEKPKS